MAKNVDGLTATLPINNILDCKYTDESL